jgi:hypothetical protein
LLLHETLRLEQPALYPVFRIFGHCPAAKPVRVCELRSTGLPVTVIPDTQASWL